MNWRARRRFKREARRITRNNWPVLDKVSRDIQDEYRETFEAYRAFGFGERAVSPGHLKLREGERKRMEGLD